MAGIAQRLKAVLVVSLRSQCRPVRTAQDDLPHLLQFRLGEYLYSFLLYFR